MRYFVAFFIAIGLIFLLIFLLFHGGRKPKTNPPALTSFASTDAQVQFTLDGPINAQQNHQQIRITVGRDDVTYEQLQGYNGQVVNMQHFANTQEAYRVFLAALAHEGFGKVNADPKLKDETGVCPLGRRYIFELTQDSQTPYRAWSTSCGSPRTYLGALIPTIDLFQAQVPGYPQLTQNLMI